MNHLEKRMALLARGELPPARKPEVSLAKGVAQLRIYDWIGGSYGGVTAQMVAEALDSMKGAGQLDVFLNSPGGSASDGVAIYNMLMRHPAKKTMYNDSLAASAASLIFLAGDERIMMPGSQVMVHGASTLVMGNSSELRHMADELDALNTAIKEIYTARTRCDPAMADAWLASKETYFDGAQAVEAGLATKVADHTMAANTTKNLSTSARGISFLDMARLRERAASKTR